MSKRIKSAVELAMERLGLEEDSSASALTEGQKAKIAEERNKAAAKLAELEILHQSQLAQLASLPPGQAQAEKVRLQENFVLERRRVEAQRDGKIERLRLDPS